MSSVSPTGYKFAATYVGTNQLSPQEVPTLFDSNYKKCF
jgi:hypothetical protein